MTNQQIKQLQIAVEIVRAQTALKDAAYFYSEYCDLDLDEESLDVTDFTELMIRLAEMRHTLEVSFDMDFA